MRVSLAMLSSMGKKRASSMKATRKFSKPAKTTFWVAGFSMTPKLRRRE